MKAGVIAGTSTLVLDRPMLRRDAIYLFTSPVICPFVRVLVPVPSLTRLKPAVSPALSTRTCPVSTHHAGPKPAI
jgi:hypothetical protein